MIDRLLAWAIIAAFSLALPATAVWVAVNYPIPAFATYAALAGVTLTAWHLTVTHHKGGRR